METSEIVRDINAFKGLYIEAESLDVIVISRTVHQGENET
jgi:hypothetical protein